jgi:hypothetical protein
MTKLELDLMEYSSDGNAQAAYVTNATEVVNQQQTSADIYRYLGGDSGSEFQVGQEFQLQSSTIVTAIEIKQVTTAGIPTGNWTLKIETSDGSDNPTGTLANANASVVVVPPGNGTIIKGTFATSFILNSDTKYHITITAANQGADKGWGISSNSTNSYSYGGVNRGVNGSWTVYYSDQALYFKIYTRSLQSYSESTIKTQGSYALKAVAAITDSLNKTLTKTFSTPLDLSGVNTAKIDMRASRTGANVKLGLHDTGGTTTELTPTINTADTYQTVSWDLSGVADADKNAIDTLTLTQINADSATTYYVDNFGISQGINIFGIVG